MRAGRSGQRQRDSVAHVPRRTDVACQPVQRTRRDGRPKTVVALIAGTVNHTIGRGVWPESGQYDPSGHGMQVVLDTAIRAAE